jgi:hypothetical protein
MAVLLIKLAKKRVVNQSSISTAPTSNNGQARKNTVFEIPRFGPGGGRIGAISAGNQERGTKRSS